jgi:hypothetical protein
LKDKELESLQQKSQSHKLTFVADDETLAAQYKVEVEKNNELQKQLNFLSQHKKLITESSDTTNKK